MSVGAGPVLETSFSGAPVKKSTSSPTRSGLSPGNPFMRPLPVRIVLAICAGVSRSPTFTNDGNAGGEPARVSPWQIAHCERYVDFADLPGLFSPREAIHAISFELT